MDEARGLYEAVQSIYDSYLCRFKCKSAMSQISQKSGVPKSTVRRFIQGEATPTFENSIAIVAVMLNKKDLGEFIDEFYPKMGGILTNTYKPDNQGQIHLAKDELNIYLRSEPADLIYNMASTRAGITRAQAQRLRGDIASDIIDDFLDKGFLIEREDGTIGNIEKEFAFWDSKAALLSAAYDLERFDRRLIGTDGAGLVKHNESVNEKGLAMLKKSLYDLSETVTKLKHDPEYQGDIPFYLTAIMNLYDRDNFKEDNQ